MMSLSFKRFSLLLCVALSLLALGADMASAAGKPTSVEVSNTHELAGYTVIELTAKVNPNGASTATTIELREEDAKLKEEKEKKVIPWIEGVVHNLSGTTVRSYSEEFRIDPVKNYEVRVKAKNLYGTTVSAIASGVSTHIRTTSEKEMTNVPFGSSGVASFVFTYGGTQFNVVCNEASNGYLGNSEGKSDIYKYSMTGCIVYVDGEEYPKCKVSNFTFTLSGATLAVQNPYFIPIPVTEGCAPGEYWQIETDPFRVADNDSSGEYSKVHSVSLTATGGLYGKYNPAEVTIESQWGLIGAYVGTPFKIASTGL